MLIRFVGRLFSAGNTDVIEEVYRKLIAVRIHRRSETVKDVSQDVVEKTYATGKTDAKEADAIFRLTALPTYDERFVVPNMSRELAIEADIPPLTNKQETGFGFRQKPGRRF